MEVMAVAALDGVMLQRGGEEEGGREGNKEREKVEVPLVAELFYSAANGDSDAVIHYLNMVSVAVTATHNTLNMVSVAVTATHCNRHHIHIMYDCFFQQRMQTPMQSYII